MNLLDKRVRASSIPSASVHVQVDGKIALHHTTGVARIQPRRDAAPDQVYDLASLTKALAGSTVAASLIEQGRVGLHTRIANVLPAVDPRITLAHLLTHSSGLPKWNNFYEQTAGHWGEPATRAHILDLAQRTPVQAEPGSQHVYTDIGFWVLLAFIEAVGKNRFDRLFNQRILDHIAPRSLRWGWPGAAATEDCPVRGGVVEGQVHDLNCVALGGVSTHAGLFGSAASVAQFADALMAAAADPDAWPNLPGRTLNTLWNTKGAGSHVGGWDTPTRGSYTSTGAYFPDDSVGHLGYTGTSLWMVPSRRTVVVLLTNRVHPVDDLTDIRALRPQIHDAVARWLGWTG